MRRILIRGARQVLTLRGSSGPRRGPALQQLSLVEDGAVLIEDGAIVEVGPTRRVENLAAAADARPIDAHGCVVMPGFVDCHAHLISGAASSSPAAIGDSTISPWVDSVRCTPAPRLKSDALDVLRRASTHGTTTMGAVGGFGIDDATELKILRLATSLVDAPVQVVPSYYGLNRVPRGMATGREQFVRHVCSSTLDLVDRRGLARFAHACCGRGHFSGAECRRFMESASARIGLRLDYAPDGPADPLISVLDDRLGSVEHLEFAGLSDVLALAAYPATAVLLPAASYYLDSAHFAHTRPLVDAGAAIALGSDFNRASAPGCSMQFAIGLACQRMKLNIEEAITAATINAAHVLRLGHRIGSLEPGKQADVILLQTPDYRTLAFEFGMNLIGVTIKGGEIVYQTADFQ